MSAGEGGEGLLCLPRCTDVPLYSRRLRVLLGIGLMHLFGVWAGDILSTYAVVGLVLGVLGNGVGVVGFSHVWLSRFRFGPAEWLWRSRTYGEAQPRRLAPGSATDSAVS